jgi:regulator of sigma E protease
VVGYGKQLKWFSVLAQGHKQVGGFKAIFDIFQVELGNVLDYHSFIINYAWSNEPITYSSTRWRSCYVFIVWNYQRQKPSDKFLENAQMVGFVLLISLLLFANGNDIYKAIVGVKKKKKCNFYLHKSNDSLSLLYNCNKRYNLSQFPS